MVRYGFVYLLGAVFKPLSFRGRRSVNGANQERFTVFYTNFNPDRFDILGFKVLSSNIINMVS